MTIQNLNQAKGKFNFTNGLKKINPTKTVILMSLLIVLVLFGCKKDSTPDITPQKLESAGGFGLYWDHEIFTAQGRCVRFSFEDIKRSDHHYSLKFDYTIKGRELLIQLVSKTDEGKCFQYPGEIDTLCSSTGLLLIPDSVLQAGTYTMTLRTSNFEVKSTLLVSDEKITLTIPENDYFKCHIKDVYPEPANILMAMVVYSGSENSASAASFFNDLKALGLTERKLPNYPYRHISVDDNGNPLNSDWTPDNHSRSFNYTMTRSFKDIVDLAQQDFLKYNIDIFIYSTNGDEARFTKTSGIRVHYAPK